jgi:hypothetical protein
MADGPQIDVNVHPEDNYLGAPSTNPALQLASSLQETNHDLTPFLGQLAGQLKTQAEDRAFKAAMANSGAAFADAVRSGKIEPTQNPWFVQAYERDAAQVRGQAQVSSLVADSQSWAERNDPQAFATKFNTQLGQIAQNYSGIDQVAGFQKAAQPLQEQALSSNVQYNVDRIQQEHVQNASSLATQSVMDTLKANPKATPDDLYQSMEAQHRQWLGVGGTEPAWRLLAGQSVLAAAANLNDPSLLDVLKAPYLGTEPLANQADEKGRPLGLQIVQDTYLINRNTEDAGMAAYKASQAAVAAEGAKVAAWANQTYGNDYAFGRIPPFQFQADAVKAGFSAPAIMWAAEKEGEVFRGAAGYSQGQTDIYSNDPQVQQRILKVNQEALTGGLTPELANELNDMVGRQQITKEMALAVMDRASSQSHFAIGEANANRREAASLSRADAGLALQRWSLVGDSAKHVEGQAGVALSNLGFDPAKLSTKTQQSLHQAIEDAAMAAGDKGPGAAEEAAGSAAARWVTSYAASHKRPGQPAVGLVNPNR